MNRLPNISRLRALVIGALLMLSLAAASAQTPSLLYSFDPIHDGVFGPFPQSVMAQGPDGNLYGTTDTGGANLMGGVFMVTPSGAETKLHDFTSSEGTHCNMGLTLGKDGNFYGACYTGGTNNEGELYRITPSGVLTILHSFTNLNGDGAAPNAPPIQASDGNFYGGTIGGGAHGDGVIYKMTPAGVVTIVHSLMYPAEGGSIGGALVQGKDGNLYGTTEEGGGIFKFTSSGKYAVLHVLSSSDGEVPFGALIQGADGNFYGTTSLGGSGGDGTLFKITPTGAFTVLHNFDPTVDGQGDPWDGLLQATNGSYYGASFRSGLSGQNSDGGLFKLTSKGVYSSLYLFDGTVGANPSSALIQHTNGLLYGNTQNEAGFNGGSVYSLNVGAKPFCALMNNLGPIGASIGILGQGFTSSSVVEFSGVPSTSIVLNGSGLLTAVVPAGALTGSVTVTTGVSTLTSKQTFYVTPNLKTFSPSSGTVGTIVTIAGSGLTQTTKVAFNGVSATFVVNSDTQVTATVPSGATSGKIAIATKGGSAVSTRIFTVD
jgi:uncharacterized repeat protein (TIGR03803 family)